MAAEIKDLVRRAEAVLMPAYMRYYPDDPLGIEYGKGAKVRGLDGRDYVDGFGGVCTTWVGHSHDEMSEALSEQLRRLTHVSTLYHTESMVQAAEALTALMPVPGCKVFWTNSGTEATEFAAHLASLYTGRQTFLCFHHSFHGRTRMAAGLTMQKPWRQRGGVTFVPGIFPVPAPYAYREQPKGMNEADYYFWLLAQIQATIDNACGGVLAGMFVEPIMGNGGVFCGPPWFYDGLVKIVHAAGGLVIADEVQTGVRRTGSWWGSQCWTKERPDIWNMAKSLGNGLPVGATVARPAVADPFRHTAHFSTFGGNPVVMTAVCKTLEIIGRDATGQNIVERGDQLRQGLQALQERHPLVGDVRGQGLFLGVELVKHPQLKEPASAETLRVMELCRNRGVLVGKGGVYGNIIRIKPPSCIQEDECAQVLDAMDYALTEVEKAA